MMRRTFVYVGVILGGIWLSDFMGDAFWLESGKIAATCFVIGCGIGIFGILFLMGGEE